MSRDCDEALANLYTYLDAELEEARSEEIKAHIAGCGGCDRPYDFERRLREVIRAKLNEEVPDAMIVRIRAVLAYEAHS